MARVYRPRRPRHPERTVLCKVLFHYFGRFLTEYAVVDRIMHHLKLTFVAAAF
jgi:hypothetical protein